MNPGGTLAETPASNPGTTSASQPTYAQQQAAQLQTVWDATTQSFQTGNPNPMIDAGQNAAVNDADRFEQRLGIGDSPISATLHADRSIHRAVNKAASTVICTELQRNGDASAYDLTIEYRFVAKLPAFIVRGYRIWAVPYVDQMRKHPALYAATVPLAKAFMQESAAVLGLRPHSLLGAAVILVGLPICALIGAVSLPLLQPCEV
jgi:hypothetical protein